MLPSFDSWIVLMPWSASRTGGPSLLVTTSAIFSSALLTASRYADSFLMACFTVLLFQLFITLMDKLRLEYRANEELQQDLRDLLDTTSRLSVLQGGKFDEHSDKLRVWYSKLRAMPAAGKLSDEEAHQMQFDIECAHNQFNNILG